VGQQLEGLEHKPSFSLRSKARPSSSRP
jgi:hypothetical protein